MTIEDIVNDYKVSNPYLLKIDCEGCKDSIILGSDLSMFERIIFEYHNYLTGTPCKKLISKLENYGFKVTDAEGNVNLGVLHLKKR